MIKAGLLALGLFLFSQTASAQQPIVINHNNVQVIVVVRDGVPYYSVQPRPLTYPYYGYSFPEHNNFLRYQAGRDWYRRTEWGRTDWSYYNRR